MARSDLGKLYAQYIKPLPPKDWLLLLAVMVRSTQWT